MTFSTCGLPARIGCALKRFAGGRRGATSIEYSLIAALVAIGLLVGLRALGAGNRSSWGETSNKIVDAMKENGSN
jgi:Flp pilus assembly pilin Flp